MLALVDAELYVDVGTCGRADDRNVFRFSSLNTLMGNNLLNWPENYVILGDIAFTLMLNFLKLFSRWNLTLEEQIYNYLLLHAHSVGENVFSIFAARFQVFRKAINLDVDVQCASRIHNLVSFYASEHLL